MKALIVTLSAEPETADVDRFANVLASLDSHNISWGRGLLGVLPSNASINSDYDFILFPQMKAGYDTLIDTAGITIPMFGLYASAGAAGFGATPGVSSSAVSPSDKWLDVPYTNESFVAAQTRSYTLSTGKALATISATVPNEGSFTGSAQTNAGNVASWRTDTAGGSYLYVSALDTGNHPAISFLLQEAVNDSVITLSNDFRRAPFFVDVDHINGEFADADPTVIDKIASYVPAGGVIWAGLTNSSTYLSAMSADVQEKLKKYSGNKFKYCYHNHGTNITSGNYPSVTESVNKTTQESNYATDKALAEGYGLEFHQPGYYNSGSNMWSESTMELFSGDTSIMSDGDETTTQVGYGFVAFRSIRQSTRSAPVRTALHHNQHAYKHTAHGILITNTWDMANGSASGGSYPDTDMPYNAISDWRKNFEYVSRGICMGMSLYMHDEDFIAADQDVGVKEHGYIQMQILSDISSYMSDVVKGFADPVDYVADTSMSLA